MADEGSTTTCSQSLETELSRYLAALKTPRDRLFISRHLGWDGLGGCNFQDIGTEFGFTRERVRQICGPILERLRRRRRAPVLDRVIAFVASHSNRSAAEIEALLIERGLTAGRFDVEGLLKTARLFGRTPRFEIERIGAERFVTTGPHVASSILTTARHMVTHWGALTTFGLCVPDASTPEPPVSETFVRRLVSAQPDFQWLNEASGWFWFTSAPRNRLVSRIEKVLCVAPHIGIPELLEAVARDRTMRSIAIPADVLRTLCSRLHWCHVEGDFVETSTSLDPVQVLGDAERRLLEILRSHGGSLPGGMLERLFLGAGLTRANLWRMLADSPIIHPIAGEGGRRCYCIAGQTLSQPVKAGSATSLFLPA